MRVVVTGAAGNWPSPSRCGSRLAGTVVPTEPGWLVLAASVPEMSTDRPRDALGWRHRPAHAAGEMVRELLAGLRDDSSFATGHSTSED